MGLSAVVIASILVVWVLTAAGLIAIGQFFLRSATYAESFFAGLAATTTFLIAYHLIAPINQAPFLLLSLIGVIWLVLNGRKVRLSFPRPRLLFGLLLVVVVAVFASRYAIEYDDGLYHIPIIQWYSAFPVVPGLANLHTRFGFNSSYYAFASLFNWLPGGASHYPAGLIWLATLAFLLQTRFGKLLVVPLCLWFGYVSTLSNDFVILCLTLVLGCKLFDVVSGKPVDQKFLILLVVLGATVKLSFAVFGGVSFVLIVYLSRIHVRALLPMLLAGAGMLTLWILHGIVLSGYPLYPLTLGAVSVDWRLPPSEAQSEYAWVWSSARMPRVPPDQVPTDWIGSWLNGVVKNVDAVLSFDIGLVGLLLSIRRRPKVLFFLPILAGLIYWFVTAPDIRFAAGLFWLLCAALMDNGVPHHHERLFKWGLAVLCVLLAFFYIQPVQLVVDDFQIYSVDGSPVAVTIPDEDRCFDYPLPCSPYLRRVEQLEFRQPGDLRAGFRSRAEPRELKLFNSE